MIDLLIHCLTASFMCLGLNLAMDEGMILNFMREWYLRMLDNIEATEAKIQILTNQKPFHWENKSMYNELEWKIETQKTKAVYYNFMYYMLKPISGCVTCMASVWGGCYLLFHYHISINVLVGIPVIAFFNYTFYKLSNHA